MHTNTIVRFGLAAVEGRALGPSAGARDHGEGTLEDMLLSVDGRERGITARGMAADLTVHALRTEVSIRRAFPREI